MSPEYSQTIYLSAGEVNAEGELSLPQLIAKFIDLATAHANSLGIGNPSMESLNGGWVLSRLSVEMTSYPRVNEEYRLTTWVESWNSRFSIRDFAVESLDGRTIYGYGRSIWMVMSTVTHENLGLSHFHLPEEMISSRPCPIPRQIKHLPIYEEIEGNGLQATAPPVRYEFKYCDIDFYRHVNTVRYVALILNQFSLAKHDAEQTERFEICFHHEGRYDRPVKILRADEPELGSTAFSIKEDCGEHRILVSARIRFCQRATDESRH